MITVQVKLYGHLRQYRPQSVEGAPHHPFFVVLDEGGTVTDLLAKLEIPEGLTAVVSINSQSAAIDTRLETDAQVSLFPPVAGGSCGS